MPLYGPGDENAGYLGTCHDNPNGDWGADGDPCWHFSPTDWRVCLCGAIAVVEYGAEDGEPSREPCGHRDVRRFIEMPVVEAAWAEACNEVEVARPGCTAQPDTWPDDYYARIDAAEVPLSAFGLDDSAT